MKTVAERLEPGCPEAHIGDIENMNSADLMAISAASIAISLKRIADLMEATCGEDSRNAWGELPFEAIGGGIARALRA